MYALHREWADDYLDYPIIDDHIRIDVRAWAVLREVTDQYFAPPKSLRLLATYIRKVGIRGVRAKVISRLKERDRNEKFTAIGFGVVSETAAGVRAPVAGASVAFLATNHPRCVDRLAVDRRLVLPWAAVPTVNAGTIHFYPSLEVTDSMIFEARPRDQAQTLAEQPEVATTTIRQARIDAAPSGRQDAASSKRLKLDSSTRPGPDSPRRSGSAPSDILESILGWMPYSGQEINEEVVRDFLATAARALEKHLTSTTVSERLSVQGARSVRERTSSYGQAVHQHVLRPEPSHEQSSHRRSTHGRSTHGRSLRRQSPDERRSKNQEPHETRTHVPHPEGPHPEGAHPEGPHPHLPRQRAERLHVPDRNSPQVKPTGVLFGLGQYAKVHILPNIRSLIDIRKIHEIDPMQIGPVRKWSVDVDTHPFPRGDEHFDVYFVAGYHHIHTPIVLDALKRGAYAVVEKPLATTHEQLRDVEMALQNTRSKLFVGFHKRYSAFNPLIRTDLRVHPGEPVNYHSLIHEMPLPKNHWYRWPHSGGRVVTNGCHWIDHFLHLNDYASVREQWAGETAGGDISVVIHLENGACCTMTLSTFGSSRYGEREYVEVTTSSGLARIIDGKRYEAENAHRVLRRTREPEMTLYRNMYRRIAAHIAAGDEGDAARTLYSSRCALDLQDRIHPIA